MRRVPVLFAVFAIAFPCLVNAGAPTQEDWLELHTKILHRKPGEMKDFATSDLVYVQPSFRKSQFEGGETKGGVHYLLKSYFMKKRAKFDASIVYKTSKPTIKVFHATDDHIFVHGSKLLCTLKNGKQIYVNFTEALRKEDGKWKYYFMEWDADEGEQEEVMKDLGVTDEQIKEHLHK